MRFKRLRISVGIALVMFILIVGNVLVFGLIQDKTTQNTSQLYTNVSEVKKVAITKTTTSSTNSVNEKLPVSNTPPSNTGISSNKADVPVVVHQRLSRAS